jgi:hypothetical protein
MIQPIDGRGVNRARATCDGCGRVEVVSADYVRGGRGQRFEVNSGQVLRKVTAQGWAEVKGKLHCPGCEAKRRAARAATKSGETEMIKTGEPLREATPAQRREIHVCLLDFYDVTAGRYRGDMTDKSVADLVGGGCMPGWVATIREADYGPDGGNEDIAGVLRDLAAWQKRADAALIDAQARSDDLAKSTAALNAARGEVASLEKRLSAICAAVGPKAGIARGRAA